MKEDVLEQLVEDYLQLEGYFTQHNVRFKPSKEDPGYVGNEHRVSSDIDVIGINPKKRGPDKVIVVSCKSWQSGFNAVYRLDQMREKRSNPRRKVWRNHRELWDPIWAKSFRAEVKEMTGQSQFHYWLAVTRLTGSETDPVAAGNLWANDERIKKNLSGSRFSFLEFGTIWDAVCQRLNGDGGQSPASSEIGRLAQLMRASEII
jgi:hypothetical protein